MSTYHIENGWLESIEIVVAHVDKSDKRRDADRYVST